jgi:hypothetical protein
VIQLTLLAAVQAHPTPAVTDTVPVAAADVVRLDDVGEIVDVQGAVNEKVFERVLDPVPPGPTALTTLS